MEACYSELILEQSFQSRTSRTRKGNPKGVDETHHRACQEGHTEVAKLFLEKADEFKLDLNVADYELEWTPFHFACHEGRRSIVDMILEKSEDVKIFVNLYDKLARTGKDFITKRLNEERNNKC